MNDEIRAFQITVWILEIIPEFTTDPIIRDECYREIKIYSNDHSTTEES